MSPTAKFLVIFFSVVLAVGTAMLIWFLVFATRVAKKI